jgi:hypothetical protein
MTGPAAVCICWRNAHNTFSRTKIEKRIREY